MWRIKKKQIWPWKQHIESLQFFTTRGPNSPRNFDLFQPMVTRVVSKYDFKKKFDCKNLKFSVLIHNVSTPSKYFMRLFAKVPFTYLLHALQQCYILWQLKEILSHKTRSQLMLRGHNWVRFSHIPCTVTLNSNFAILKTLNCFQLV